MQTNQIDDSIAAKYFVKNKQKYKIKNTQVMKDNISRLCASYAGKAKNCSF